MLIGDINNIYYLFSLLLKYTHLKILSIKAIIIINYFLNKKLMELKLSQYNKKHIFNYKYLFMR